MDLRAYWSVLAGQRLLVIVGLALSAIIAALALFSFSSSGVSLRSPRVYVGESTVFVTQTGFPWGRAALDEYVTPRGGNRENPVSPVPRFAEAGRMEYLTALYAELAESDLIRRKLDPSGKAELEYDVVALASEAGSDLPLLRISGFSTSPTEALAISNRVGRELITYVSRNQNESGIPPQTRVELAVVAAADEAEIFEGIRLTPPLMLFVLGLTATILIAFTRHNMQLTRVPTMASVEDEPYTVALPESQIAVGGSTSRATSQGRNRNMAVAPQPHETEGSASDGSVAAAARAAHGTQPSDELAQLGKRPASERWKPRN